MKQDIKHIQQSHARHSFMAEKPDVPVPDFSDLGFDPTEPFWVFGYGSLIWDPGFEYAQKQEAYLKGYARSFCVKSTHYRGTAASPGLVLGLDVGEDCSGCAFEVAECSQTVLTYLWHREMSLSPYRHILVPVTLADGRKVTCLTFCVETSHSLYRPFDCYTRVAEIIATTSGKRGPCRDYLQNTVTHLAELGISDPHLEKLWQHVLQIDVASY